MRKQNPPIVVMTIGGLLTLKASLSLLLFD